MKCLVIYTFPNVAYLIAASLFAVVLSCLMCPTSASASQDSQPNPPVAFCVEEKDGLFRLIHAGNEIGHVAPFASDTVQAEDTLEQIEPGVFQWTRRFSLKPGQDRQAARLTMDFVADHGCLYSMIPGILYDGNEIKSGLDQGNVYKGYSLEGKPLSFAWHRTTVPGATYSEGAKYSVGLFGRVDDTAVGLACSLIPSDTETLHGLIFPEEEMPKRIIFRESGMAEGRANTLILEPGQEFTACGYLVLDALNKPRMNYKHLLDTAWKQNFKETAARRPADELWTMGVQFAKQSLWNPEKRMFACGLLQQEGKWTQRKEGFEIGWAGRNASLANALLRDFIKTGDTSSRDMAIACLDEWAILAKKEKEKKGCPLSRFYAIAADANQLGTTAYEFLVAADLAHECGIDRSGYRELALGICDAAVTSLDAAGRFTDPSAAKGFIGASLLPALLFAHAQTQNDAYLRAASAANECYMRTFRALGFQWGATLDTNGVDCESSFPLIQTNVMLYELTHDSKYLTYAEDLAYYEVSWQLAQTIPAPVGTLMAAVGYETLGTHVVATLHMCAHSYSLLNFKYFIRLSEYTKNPTWKQRAVSMWNVATAGISNGTLELMDRGPRPVGAQDETYNHTDWGYYYAATGNLDERNPRGAGSQWLVAWPTALRLDILADAETRKVVEQIPVCRTRSDLPPTK